LAKHSKGNNIISYDEAKKKILREKEEQLNENSAKHFRNGNSSYEETFEDGYFDDAINYGNEAGDKENQNSNSARGKHSAARDREREYYAHRDAKYAEKKEPLPRNLVNLIIIALMTLFLAIISAMLYNYYVVETINVNGNHDITYHNITELCGVDYKQSMLTVNKEDIIESFESRQPMVEVVDVQKIWPNILEITVKERPPVCYLVLKGSQKCALIGEGNICLAIQDSYLDGDIPRIYGLDVGSGELGKEITDGEARKLEVLKEIISAMLETDCIAELESININNTTNILMQSIHGTQIKMGDASNLVTKLSNVKIMLAHLLSQNNTEVTMIVTGDNSIYIE